MSRLSRPPDRVPDGRRSRARRLVAVALAATWLHVGAPEPVTAQERETTIVFDLLEGSWRGSGTLLGRDGAFRMEWSRIDGRTFRLEYANAFVNGDGSTSPVLSATATYVVSDEGSVSASWTDSRPQELRIEATTDGARLVSEWTAPSETGRTEYVVREDGTALVRDWVRDDSGALRLFGEAEYERAPGGS